MAANFTPTAPSLSRGNVAPADDARFSWFDAARRPDLILLVIATIGVVVGYWRILESSSQVWSQPQYSHGWIIPLIALYLLYSMRPNPIESSKSDGVNLGQVMWGFVGLGGVMMGAGAGIGIEWLQGVGLAIVVVGAFATLLQGQPYAPLSKDWSIDLSERSEGWLLAGTGAGLVLSIALVTVASMRISLPITNQAALTIPFIIYLVTLLAVALSSDQDAKRSGAETLAALAIIVGSLTIWVYASRVDAEPLIRYSFLATLLGVFTLLGGLRFVRWAGPPAAFLFFMFPLPAKVEQTALIQLQKIAAIASEVIYTIIGVPVFRRGATLEVEGIPMEVAQACSGLSMSTILMAMAVALAMLMRRPWWDRFIVLLAAVPIALIANVVRIVVIGLAWIVMERYYPTDESVVGSNRMSLHDSTGPIVVMVVAMGLLWLLFKILSSLSVPEEGAELQSAGVGSRGASRTGAAPLP